MLPIDKQMFLQRWGVRLARRRTSALAKAVAHKNTQIFENFFLDMADVELDRLEKLAEFANRCYMSFEDKYFLGERHEEYMILIANPICMIMTDSNALLQC